MKLDVCRQAATLLTFNPAGLEGNAAIIDTCGAVDRHHRSSSSGVPVPQKGGGSVTTDSRSAASLSGILSQGDPTLLLIHD